MTLWDPVAATEVNLTLFLNPLALPGQNGVARRDDLEKPPHRGTFQLILCSSTSLASSELGA